jgi:hypothetical protein
MSGQATLAVIDRASSLPHLPHRPAPSRNAAAYALRRLSDTRQARPSRARADDGFEPATFGLGVRRLEASTRREDASAPSRSLTKEEAPDVSGTNVLPKGSGTGWNGPRMDHVRFAAKETPAQTRVAIALSRR